MNAPRTSKQRQEIFMKPKRNLELTGCARESQTLLMAALGLGETLRIDRFVVVVAVVLVKLT